MQIKIDENTNVEQDQFPAFFKDGDGDLWFFRDEDHGCCLGEHDTLDFGYEFVKANENYDGLTRIRGTITITQE